MKSVIATSNTLKTACQFLDPQEHQQLIKDVELVCEQLVNPNFRIAVLAPFNFGKSTLINALLGQDIMPVKMVRTTGTVIRIKYGKTLTTIITLKSGEIIRSNDTEILKEFSVLNRKGQRREDVSSVEVLYPHFLLKNGVELLDLPGTNDREAQDILVRDQLLQVDLVIQILNARQPFTQGEQDTLNQWLIERGIKTVIFVLNRSLGCFTIYRSFL
jgi:predicted GTPase